MASRWSHRLLMAFITIGITAIIALLAAKQYPKIFAPFLKSKKSSPLPELGLEILPRRNWRAKDQTGPTEPLGKPARLTVHHQGGAVFQKDDLQATIDEIRSIQKDHQQNRGWSDIGYHFIIDRAGRIWEGRPISDMGAHAGNGGANIGNIGVVVLGNFDEQTLAKMQESALESLLSRLCSRWNINRKQVRTHNEMRLSAGEGKTNCPGKHLADWVHRFRN